MKKFLFFLFICASVLPVKVATAQGLPKGFSPVEQDVMLRGEVPPAPVMNGIASPPPFDNIRSMAEWEEVQALTIAWTGYPSILKQIAANAKTRTKVIILTDDPAGTEEYLTTANAGGAALSMTNIELVEGAYNSIWMRDYAANPVYGNEVDTLVLVDWIYNRPTRPEDDASPSLFADHLGLNLYTMTQAPNDLVNTGGNWMSDGFGTAFASKLILEENVAGNPYGVSAKTETQIDAIVNEFLGIDRYIKMETLPYDGIHHIDMHMKLLDEETLLVGEYPAGIADGPQINANIEYVLSNFNSKWGTPYKVIRIPMPDSPSGLWPDDNPPALYRTYTNAVFVNDMIIYPSYRDEYDTTAFRIWQESMPGYQLVPIDCDDNGNNIIAQSGAIHCITHSVGVADPLLISHQPLRDTDNTTVPYEVAAYMNHRSGMASATLYWKTDLNAAYASVEMTSIGDNNWRGFIPAQPAGTHVYYYVQGQAVSGKSQVRPIAAPAGYWHFRITGANVDVTEFQAVRFQKVFPNPAGAITCIELGNETAQRAMIDLVDLTGKKVADVYNGTLTPGMQKIFFDASQHAAGAYLLRCSIASGEVFTTRVMIK